MSMTVDPEGTVVEVGDTADVDVSLVVDVLSLSSPPPHAANRGPATTIVTRTLAIPLR
jgi:hypothetical protein